METQQISQRLDALENEVHGLADEIVGRAKEQISANLKGDFDQKFAERNELHSLEQKFQALKQELSQNAEMHGESGEKKENIAMQIAEKIHSKNATSQAFETRQAITSDMVGGVEFLGIKVPKLKRFTIFDILPVRYRRGLAYTYNRLGFENNADVVGELQTKPQSNFTKEQVELYLRKIAHYAEVSLEAEITAEDLGEDIEAIVRTRLYNGIVTKAEWQAIQGDGVTTTAYGGKQWNGLLSQATAFDTSLLPNNANKIDTLRLAMAQVTSNDGWVSGVFLNNIDWALMEIAKVNDDGTGAYVLGKPETGSTEKRVWGIPVVDTQATPQGQFVLGAFDEGAAEIVLQRRGIITIKGLKGDDLINNQFTIVSELFGNVACEEPLKVVKGAFA